MRMVVCATLVLLAGCGGDKATAPQRGTLVFKIDPVTCTGTGTVEYFIDGTSQGVYSASAGTTQPFTVDAGSHTAAARETSAGGHVWATQNVSVPANGSYTAVLAC